MLRWPWYPRWRGAKRFTSACVNTMVLPIRLPMPSVRALRHTPGKLQPSAVATSLALSIFIPLQAMLSNYLRV